MRLMVGEYEIVGNLHVPPGTPLDTQVLSRRQNFVAVTDAYVQSMEAFVFERAAPVVLVNAGQVAQLRDMLTVH